MSPACANCYAEGVDHRFTRKDGGEPHWGPAAPRRVRVKKAREEAFRYNKRAEREGIRYRVFCASMADFFEDRRDLDAPRIEFLDVIRMTPSLDWLILTKRPEAILPLLNRAKSWLAAQTSAADMDLEDLLVWVSAWIAGNPPANVAIGTTVESQDWAAPRLNALVEVPARTRFVSVEPMLGPVDLRSWLAHNPEGPGVHWVICGGESGSHSRAMALPWAHSLANQVMVAGGAFFMKQLSEVTHPGTYEDLEAFPLALQVRQFPLALNYA